MEVFFEKLKTSLGLIAKLSLVPLKLISTSAKKHFERKFYFLKSVEVLQVFLPTVERELLVWCC